MIMLRKLSEMGRVGIALTLGILLAMSTIVAGAAGQQCSPGKGARFIF
jgi:hypothetical protein